MELLDKANIDYVALTEIRRKLYSEKYEQLTPHEYLAIDLANEERLGRPVFRHSQIDKENPYKCIEDSIRWCWSQRDPDQLRKALGNPELCSWAKKHNVLHEFCPSEIPHCFITIRLVKSLPSFIHDSVNSLQFDWLLKNEAIGCLEDMETNPHLHILIKNKHHKHNIIKVLCTYFRKAKLVKDAANIDFLTSTDPEVYIKREAYVRGTKVPSSKKAKVLKDKAYRLNHGLPDVYEWI